MLPNLSALSVPAGGAKRKRDDDGPIFFKAAKRGPWRKLSNLFGDVEWRFQAAKFRDGSAVHAWLLEGARKARAGEWTPEAFDAARKRMKHEGKLESYVEGDAVASGLLAQFTSLIAKNPDGNNNQRHRLGYILGRDEPVSKEEMNAWHAQNVMPEIDDAAKRELMLTLVRDKFSSAEGAEFRALLLSTGDRALHEAKGMGRPSNWEYVDKELTPELIEKGWTKGGDWLGQILTRVRAELRGAA